MFAISNGTGNERHLGMTSTPDEIVYSFTLYWVLIVTLGFRKQLQGVALRKNKKFYGEIHYAAAITFKEQVTAHTGQSSTQHD